VNFEFTGSRFSWIVSTEYILLNAFVSKLRNENLRKKERRQVGKSKSIRGVSCRSWMLRVR